MKKIVIAAVAKNNVIGRSNGEMPWHIKEEFQHFKNTTFGYPIIMGRKTFESLGEPLKGRLNIVLSRKDDFSLPFENTKIFKSLSDAVNFCAENNYEKIFLIGGGQIFPKAIEIADELIISRLNFDAEGDIRFPEIDLNVWKAVQTVEHELFTIFYYNRINNAE